MKFKIGASMYLSVWEQPFSCHFYEVVTSVGLVFFLFFYFFIFDTIWVSMMRILLFFETTRVWVFDGIFHLGVYTMQEPL
jgi:hypothetical protein